MVIPNGSSIWLAFRLKPGSSRMVVVSMFGMVCTANRLMFTVYMRSVV